jgi:ribosome recycling factor
MDNLISDLETRMSSAIAALKVEFGGLRTGRASSDLLAPIQVESYGALSPINQVANVTVGGARLINVQVWDKGLIQAVEKAIRESDLGLNPNTDGDVIRINLPELNEERRKELVKFARKYAESGRVSVRNVRRDGMDSVKKAEKAGDISEDDLHRINDQIQKITDTHVKTADDLLASKEADIMQV